jgi:hypothetical protein
MSLFRLSPCALTPSSRPIRLGTLWFLLSTSLACGSVDPNDPGSDTGGTGAGGADSGSGGAVAGRLFPLKTGNTWTLRTTAADGVAQTKVQRVLDLEAVGGVGPNAGEQAYRVVSDTKDGTDQTISWQADLGDRVVRYREQSFKVNTTPFELTADYYWDKYKLRVDERPERLVAGRSFTEEYVETSFKIVTSQYVTELVSDEWLVVSTRESVTVEAGTFDAVVVERDNRASSTKKKYWFVPGIGKVKETGTKFSSLTGTEVPTQTEELVSYEIDQ